MVGLTSSVVDVASQTLDRCSCWCVADIVFDRFDVSQFHAGEAAGPSRVMPARAVHSQRRPSTFKLNRTRRISSTSGVRGWLRGGARPVTPAASPTIRLSDSSSHLCHSDKPIRAPWHHGGVVCPEVGNCSKSVLAKCGV